MESTKKTMTFKEAYAAMLAGKKVTRPVFKGYWFIDPKTLGVVIHLASGKDITYGKLDITVRNTLCDDWVEFIDESIVTTQPADVCDSCKVEKPVEDEKTETVVSTETKTI
jgi:hypothetical protein